MSTENPTIEDDLRAEIARLRKRLEIDHCYHATENGELIRRELTDEESVDFPDAVECRDATIELLTEDISHLQDINGRLVDALKPFSAADFSSGVSNKALIWGNCTVGDFRIARALLSELEQDDGPQV